MGIKAFQDDDPANWPESGLTKILLASAAVLAGCGILLGPLLLGSVTTWPRLGLELSMAGVASLVLCSERRGVGVWAGTFAVGAGVALYAVFLPKQIIAILAPAVAALWEAGGPEASYASLSVAPHLSGSAAVRLLLALWFAVAVALMATRLHIRNWIVRAIAASCVALWLVALLFPVQRGRSRVVMGFVDLSGPLQWWLNPIRPPRETAGFGYRVISELPAGSLEMIDWGIGDGFGSYIISNHFAAGLYLTLPMLFAVMWRRLERLPGWGRAAIVIGGFTAAGCTLAISAQSRAGAVALISGGLVFLALTATIRSLRLATGSLAVGWIAIIVVYGAILHGYLGPLGKYFPRFWEQKLAEHLNDPRVVATNVAEDLFVGSPLSGWGPGTYGVLYPAATNGSMTQYYAHNDYAQVLAETGLAGGLLLAVSLVWLGLAFGSALLNTELTEGRSLAAASLSGLIALAVHSLYDWNLHVPANAFLGATLAGLAVATATWHNRPFSELKLNYRWQLGLLRGVGLTAIALASCWAVRDAVSDETARTLRHVLVDRRAESGRPLSPEQVAAIREMAAKAEAQADRDPWNAELAFLLGQLHAILPPQGLGNEAVQVRNAEAAAWLDRARAVSRTVSCFD